MHRNILILYLLYNSLVIGAVAQSIEALEQKLQKKLHDTVRIQTLNELAHALKYKDIKRMHVLVREAMQLSDSIHYSLGQAESWRQFAIYYRAVGLYTQATESLYKALEIFEKINNKNGVANIYNTLGNIYAMQKEHQQSYEYYHKSLKIFLELKETKRIATLYSNLGSVFLAEKKLDSALFFYQKSLKMSEEMQLESLQLSNWRCLAETYLEKKEWLKSWQYIEFTAEKARKMSENRELALILYLKAKWFFRQNNNEEAEESALEALQVAQKAQLAETFIEASMLLSDIYVLTNRYKEAFLVQQRREKLEDSLKIHNSKAQIEAYQLEYKNKNQINTLKKAAESQRNWLFALGVFIFLLFAALVFSFNFYQKILWQRKQLQHLNAQLKTFNQNLDQDVKERTQKLKEKNEKLEEIAFLNSHRVRAYAARMMGLLSIINYENLDTISNRELLSLLYITAQELDKLLHQITDLTENLEEIDLPTEMNALIDKN